jgi:FkbM family methyltransferase
VTSGRGLTWLSNALRFVPPGLGAQAVARAVVARARHLPAATLVQTLAGGARITLDLSDPGQAQVYLTRRYEPDVVNALARRARTSGVLFDVGANIGLVTFSVGVRRADLSIVAFEADPANARRWRQNRELNPSVNAVLEEVAIGVEEGVVSVVHEREAGWSHVAARGEGSVDVRMTTLDAYARTREISVIDALKIDVEGFEAKVLEGAGRLLATRAIRMIVCELDDSLLQRSGSSRDEIVSQLSDLGYSAQPVPGVAAQRLRRRPVETHRDVLFLPR